MAVARASAGGMRDSQSLLDQLITLGEGSIRSSDLANLLAGSSGRLVVDLWIHGDAARPKVDLDRQKLAQRIAENAKRDPAFGMDPTATPLPSSATSSRL